MNNIVYGNAAEILLREGIEFFEMSTGHKFTDNENYLAGVLSIVRELGLDISDGVYRIAESIYWNCRYGDISGLGDEEREEMKDNCLFWDEETDLYIESLD